MTLPLKKTRENVKWPLCYALAIIEYVMESRFNGFQFKEKQKNILFWLHFAVKYTGKPVSLLSYGKFCKKVNTGQRQRFNFFSLKFLQ